MTVQSRPRILIIDDDPVVQADLVQMLRPLEYSVMCARGVGKELQKEALTLASTFRPHVAVVDIRLEDEYREDDRSGIELLKGLQSAMCIQYSAYLTAVVTREIKNKTITWVSKHESPQRLVDEITSAARKVCAQKRNFAVYSPSSWASRQIVHAIFGKDSEVPSDIADDVFSQLFPENDRIALKTLDVTTANLGSTGRDRSVVMQAWRNRIESLVVKLAPSARIGREGQNYNKYIRGNLGGRFHTIIEKDPVIFWDLGGVLYAVPGASDQALTDFATFYGKESSSKDILKSLQHFFTRVWRDLYQTTTTNADEPLFYLYDEILHLEEQMLSFPNQEKRTSFPGVAISLPNPVSWVLRHKNDSLVPSARQAVTHGNLHGNNLFVDGSYAWAIDFEYSGLGPILRDFAELEVDIVTRLVSLPEGDLVQFYELAVVLAEPVESKTLLHPTTKLWQDSDTRKALEVISGLRKLAYEVISYSDSREYVWGLLLNALLVALMTPEGSSQRDRALLFGSVLCGRLQHWNEEWPQKDWPSVTPLWDEQEEEINNTVEDEPHNVIITPELRLQLTDALLLVPATNTSEGRTALLSGISSSVQLNRNAANARSDIVGIVEQLSNIGYLTSGDWPLLVLIDNALPYVKGTKVGQDLQAIKQTLADLYGEV